MLVPPLEVRRPLLQEILDPPLFWTLIPISDLRCVTWCYISLMTEIQTLNAGSDATVLELFDVQIYTALNFFFCPSCLTISDTERFVKLPCCI